MVIVKLEGFGIRCVVRGERAAVIKRPYEESWRGNCLRSVGVWVLSGGGVTWNEIQRLDNEEHSANTNVHICSFIALVA